MLAEIIGIGDELLYGLTTNSNATEIAAKLMSIGVEPRHLTTVGDDAAAMTDALKRAFSRVDVVITTGGLGPTPDDFTQKVVADYFGMKIVEFPDLLEEVQKKYGRLKRPMPEFARNQSWFPVGATRINNPIGTATGIEVEHEGKLLFVLPGVPSEAMIMTDQTILPKLAAIPRSEIIAYKLIRTIGWGETQIQEKIGTEGLKQIEETGCGLAFLPKHGMVDLRITARAAKKELAETKLAKALPVLLKATEGIRYTIGNDTLIETIKHKLENENEWLATAESCTGGMIAEELTNVPGISAVYRGGVVAYHNDTKSTMLDVPHEMLAEYGAVSQEVAETMALNACRRLNANYSISVTGISGPTGGTEEKPVGTVWIAIGTRERFEEGDRYDVISKRFVFPGPRHVHRVRTMNKALEMLWHQIVG